MSRAMTLPECITSRTVLGMAWPVMISMLSYTAMSVVDTIFVGRLGTTELAAIGLASVAVFLVHAFPNGLLSGSKVAISQRTGAGDDESARRLAWQGLWFAGLAGVVVASLAPLGHGLFGLLGASSAVAEHAHAFFSVRLMGAPLLFVTLAMNAYFHGRGDMRTPMVATVLGNVINVALDPIFIFGTGPVPAMEIQGAALSTLLGFGASSTFLVWRARSMLLGTESRPSAELVAETWRLGGPIGIRYLLDVGAFVVFASMLARVGEVELAAHVMVVRVISVSFLPGYAVSEAASVLVGQSVGAGRSHLARQAFTAATRVAVAIMVVGGIAFVLMPALLLRPFGAEAAVVEVAVSLMLIAAAFQVFDAVAMVAFGALNGAGDTRFTLWASISAAWLVKLPIGWLLAMPLGMGAAGAWLGLTAEIIVVAAIGLFRIRGEAWLQRAQPSIEEVPVISETEAAPEAPADVVRAPAAK